MVYTFFSTVKKNWTYCVLFIFLVLYVANNCYWISLRQLPLGSEELYQITMTIKVDEIIREAIFNLSYTSAHTFSPHLPPLMHIFVLCMLWFFPLSFHSLLYAHTLFVFPLGLALFFVGNELGDKKTGLLSVMILFLFPGFLIYSKFYNPELLLIAMVVLAFYFLLKSAGFRKRKESLFFGITVGLGLLTKTVFPIYIIGPVLLVVGLLVRDMLYLRFVTVKDAASFQEKGLLRTRYCNSSIAFVCAIVIAWWWYSPRGIETLMDANTHFFTSVIPSHAGPIQYFFDQISAPYILFGLISFTILAVRHVKKIMLLVLWIIIPLVFYSVCETKVDRYTLACMPAIALIIALGIHHITWRLVRIIAILGILMIGGFYMVVCSYATYTSPYVFIRKLGMGIDVLPYHILRYCPERKEWHFSRVTKKLEGIVSDPSKKIVVIKNPETKAPYLWCLWRLQRFPAHIISVTVNDIMKEKGRYHDSDAYLYFTNTKVSESVMLLDQDDKAITTYSLFLDFIDTLSPDRSFYVSDRISLDHDEYVNVYRAELK